jgi:hypothetical protein
MKLTTTTLWQVVTLLAAAGNEYGSVVPDRYKPAVTAIAGIAVILLHWHAGVHDPDGTPAHVESKGEKS